MRKIAILFLLGCLFMKGDIVFAQVVPFTLEDRDRLIRMEAHLEQIEKRFEQVDKRFEQVDKRFEEVLTFMWMLVTIFVSIVAVVIGFALWDRRTMIRPFEVKVKEVEGVIGIEKEKLSKLLTILRQLAKKDVELAAALKGVNLL